MSNSKFTLLEDRKVLKIGGDDAREFLQGLVSNDMKDVTPEKAIYAALLTPQGKYLHDFFILQMGNNFVLDCEASRRDDLFKRFRLYKLRSEVELELDDTFCIAAITGDQAPAAAGVTPTAGAAAEFLNGMAYVDPRLTAMGVRAVLPSGTARESLAAKGFIEAPFTDYDEMRISMGMPDSSRDMDIEKSVLLECGFEELNGVSFDKGCYTGQELTARTKHRGLVKKRLVPVIIEGPAPAPGTELTVDGKNAGEMRSARGDSGLALIRLEILDDKKEITSGSTTLRPVRPDWMVI